MVPAINSVNHWFRLLTVLDNEAVFNNASLNIEREINNIKIKIWSWTSVREGDLSELIIGEWLGDP